MSRIHDVEVLIDIPGTNMSKVLIDVHALIDVQILTSIQAPQHPSLDKHPDSMDGEFLMLRPHYIQAP